MTNSTRVICIDINLPLVALLQQINLILRQIIEL
jgi:hypothetical protein